jgi:excisionase family DNA binding protein
MEKLWTTQEVAQCLGIEEADVEQLMRQGKLTAYRLGGQFLRFKPGQVEALKGTLRFRRRSLTQTRPGESWVTRLRDLVYFYDFYVVSASLLAALVVYLVVSG